MIIVKAATFIIVCLTATYSWSQTELGYSGDFKVLDKNTTYHFTLVNGSLLHPVYTMIEDTKYINTMYLSDSMLLSGVDSMMIVHKKDSLLKHFIGNFEGTYVRYNKKGKMTVAMHLTKPLNSDVTFYNRREDLRMNFYPNGKPYAQFYLKNGSPSRNVIYFTRDGEIDQKVDLSQYRKGEEVLIQNPWDFRMKRKMLKILIE
ncbi:hypothetical protein [Fluviicola taffensis]|uniref:Uncharacterized protein n=1 Tax=Fluviicola taffensis (strain DSM 16823 / NCIMB 13979 / RW262) TaxID=755732 RepID=F2ICX6_FLUTR|nr:hypothetical protein [Fluviicola taffensis]AEA43350.1 hypothetical protein Fluta_1355 [Fluviicola taffensis DSM 16823]